MEAEAPPPLVSPRVRGFALGVLVGGLLGAAVVLAAVLAWSRISEDDETFDPSTTVYRGVVIESDEPTVLCVELSPVGQDGTSDSTRCAASVRVPPVGTSVTAVRASWCDRNDECDAMWLEVAEG